MFRRGRTDHFALLAPTEEAFRELRGRIEAEGAADGDVRDMQSHWIMGFFDPDGAAHEGMLERPGRQDSDMLERADWTTVTLDYPVNAPGETSALHVKETPELETARDSRDERPAGVSHGTALACGNRARR
jgi:hypothetical protein